MTSPPRTSDGNIDWNTLGNIISAHILGEVLCASYVDYKYGQRSKEFKAQTDWQYKLINTPKKREKLCLGYRVLLRREGSNCTEESLRDSPINAFMGRCVIDRPINEVIRFLDDHERRKEWDKYLAEVKVLKRISNTDFIYYMVLETKQCLVKLKRDMIIFARNVNIGDKHVRTTVSVELDEYPPYPGITRANVLPGTGFVCEKYEGREDKTLLSWCAHCDLRNLPPVIVNQGMKRQPMAVYLIREILSGYQDLPSADQKDQHQNDGCTTVTTNSIDNTLPETRIQSSVGYEDGLPVNEFLL